MKPASFVLATILLSLFVSSVTAYTGPFSSITGAAIAAPDHMDFSLYEGERDVGTANPGSNGQARAIAAGQTMRILLEDVRYDGQTILHGVVSILVRQGNVEMVTLTATINDGSGAILFDESGADVPLKDALRLAR